MMKDIFIDFLKWGLLLHFFTGNGTTFARSKTEGSKKKKSDTALEIVWICGEYMSEDYLGHFGPFR